MAKGIRQFCNERFAEILPKFQLGEWTGTQFRAAVLNAVDTEFKIGLAAASTHYNHSLKKMKDQVPYLVDGLGRPEGVGGGRKVKHGYRVVDNLDGTVLAENISKAQAEKMLRESSKHLLIIATLVEV